MPTHTATDASGNSASYAQQIHVVDTTPPAIAGATPSATSLWPPDGRMVAVTISPVNLTDACHTGAGGASCVITTVTSDEPNDDDAPDWEIVPPLTVLLRAERAGRGDGRVYTVTFACTDRSNNSSTRTALVNVPHSRGR